MLNNTNYGVIVQARNSSSRLVGKMTMPFYEGKTILELILINLINGLKRIPVIVATTNNKTDDSIAITVKKMNLQVYRGEEYNVLNRILNVAVIHGIDNIIRVCADNPFLNIESISDLIACHKKHPIDYTSYLVGDKKPAILSHFGFYAEIVPRTTLEKVATKTSDSLYQEHVTNYIYTHPTDFELSFLKAPSYIYGRNDIRLTVDTIQDFELTQSLYASMIENDWNQRELINFIDSNIAVKKTMNRMIELNKK